MFIMPPPHRKGAISVAFVRPFIRLSVCPSVAYIANNSRTQRPSVTKSGRKVPHLRYDWHTGFKIEKSKVATRPINADTHCAPYLPNGKAYKLQTWYTDGGRRPASATGAMTSNVKGQGRKVMWSVWAVLAQWAAYKSKTNSRSITKICTWCFNKVPKRVCPTIVVTSKVKGLGHKLTASVCLISASS